MSVPAPKQTTVQRDGRSPRAAQPLLEMRRIEKRFGGVHALKGVDFTLEAGRVVALIGENGAGKSTLMKILGGVVAPDAGEILIDGRPVAIRSAADAIRHGISFIHQELNVLDNLDVAGNVFLGREPRRWRFLLDQRRMAEEAERFLRRLGAGISARAPLGALSIAQQQLVEIAKALSLDARILIMDEPTSSLTLQETEKLLEIVGELRAAGVAVVYISHRLGEVERIADRVVVLRDGAVVGTLERDEITHDRMVQMMVGRDLDIFRRRAAKRIEPGYFRVRELRTARYPQHPVSLEIGKGEILGLAGLVGAGRTELAEALFGVAVAPDANGAKVVLGGEELTIRAPEDAIRHGIYLVPEDRRHAGLILNASVRENVTLPSLARYARAGLVSLARERRAAAEICARLRVKAPSVEVPALDLSGGNQQKVVLAKWLAREPRVIIFDEPTRGIDVGAKAEIYELMRQLAASGVAILMISSEMEEILDLSDRVAVMHEGRLMGTLDRDRCTEEAIMRLAVGMKPQDQT